MSFSETIRLGSPEGPVLLFAISQVTLSCSGKGISESFLRASSFLIFSFLILSFSESIRNPQAWSYP